MINLFRKIFFLFFSHIKIFTHLRILDSIMKILCDLLLKLCSRCVVSWQCDKNEYKQFKNIVEKIYDQSWRKVLSTGARLRIGLLRILITLAYNSFINEPLNIFLRTDSFGRLKLAKKLIWIFYLPELASKANVYQ